LLPSIVGPRGRQLASWQEVERESDYAAYVICTKKNMFEASFMQDIKIKACPCPLKNVELYGPMSDDY